MAQQGSDGSGDDGPSLELPSFFGRKRRREKTDEAVSTVEDRDRTPEQPATVVYPQEDPPAPTRDEPSEDEAREPAPAASSRPRLPSLPQVGGMAAAVISGALVGVLTVGLTWGSLRLCEVVQGTSSCGNPGFFLLLAILISMVVLGKALLGALGGEDPGSTSFLGMSLVAAIVLVFLVNLLFNWWMVLVVPVVAMGAFALSSWITTTFAGPETGTSTHR